MGAHIDGAGSSTLAVDGVSDLTPTDHTIVGDRIEAGTLLFACAIAGGDVLVEGVPAEHLETVIRKLGEMGVAVTITPDGIAARSVEPLSSVDVQTLPFPGFATDFMPLAVATLAVADGTAIVTENVFDNRFAFVGELHRMGADVSTEGRHAVVRGRARLSGAPVRVSDVRAGAALLLAGLAADGETTVVDTHHVERGYADLPGRLRALGADVTRDRRPGPRRPRSLTTWPGRWRRDVRRGDRRHPAGRCRPTAATSCSDRSTTPASCASSSSAPAGPARSRRRRSTRASSGSSRTGSPGSAPSRPSTPPEVTAGDPDRARRPTRAPGTGVPSPGSCRWSRRAAPAPRSPSPASTRTPAARTRSASPGRPGQASRRSPTG